MRSLEATPRVVGLSRQERVARLQRRRRSSRAQAVLGAAIWVAGSAVVGMIAFAGLLGLR